MSEWIRPTWENVDGLFDGVMIPVVDPAPISLAYQVPGWKCKGCGWTVGARGLPPTHHCDPRGRAAEDTGADGEGETT